ncbi:MAG: hypothetical protein U0528_17215 [Anaerolineae bacterium]
MRAAFNIRQFQRPFVLWLVIWMALFAPAVCQYHGLLVRAHTQHDHAAAVGQASAVSSDPFDYLCGMSLQAQSPSQTASGTSSAISGLVDHQPLSSNTLMLMSLLVLALPSVLLLYLNRERGRPDLRQDRHPLQPSQLVLTPPPR